jgi:hypothetical protein
MHFLNDSYFTLSSHKLSLHLHEWMKEAHFTHHAHHLLAGFQRKSGDVDLSGKGLYWSSCAGSAAFLDRELIANKHPAP